MITTSIFLASSSGFRTNITNCLPPSDLLQPPNAFYFRPDRSMLPEVTASISIFSRVSRAKSHRQWTTSSWRGTTKIATWNSIACFLFERESEEAANYRLQTWSKTKWAMCALFNGSTHNNIKKEETRNWMLIIFQLGHHISISANMQQTSCLLAHFFLNMGKGNSYTPLPSSI